MFHRLLHRFVLCLTWMSVFGVGIGCQGEDRLTSENTQARVIDTEAAPFDVDAIVRELRSADVMMFQEVVRPSENDPSVAEQIAAKLGLNVEFASPDGGKTESGIAILSRFPLTEVKLHRVTQVHLVFRLDDRQLAVA